MSKRTVEELLEAVGLTKDDCHSVGTGYVLKEPIFVLGDIGVKQELEKTLLIGIKPTQIYCYHGFSTAGSPVLCQTCAPIPEVKMVPLEMEDYDKMDKLVFICKEKGKRFHLSKYTEKCVCCDFCYWSYKEFSEKFTHLDGSPLTKEVQV